MPREKGKSLTISTNFTVKLNKIDPQCENVFQPSPVRGNDNVPTSSNYTCLHFDIYCFLHGSYASSGTNSFANNYLHRNFPPNEHTNSISYINTNSNKYLHYYANNYINRNHHRQPKSRGYQKCRWR